MGSHRGGHVPGADILHAQPAAQEREAVASAHRKAGCNGLLLSERGLSARTRWILRLLYVPVPGTIRNLLLPAGDRERGARGQPEVGCAAVTHTSGRVCQSAAAGIDQRDSPWEGGRIMAPETSMTAQPEHTRSRFAVRADLARDRISEWLKFDSTIARQLTAVAGTTAAYASGRPGRRQPGPPVASAIHRGGGSAVAAHLIEGRLRAILCSEPAFF